MYRSVGVIVAVVCVASLAGSSPAQQKHVLQHPVRSGSYPYSNTAFSGFVPPHFQGNDLQSIAASLARGYAARGEFETTAQYNARILKSNATPIADGISRDASLAFVFPSDVALKSDWEAKNQIGAQYDADAKAFKIDITAHPTFVEYGSPSEVERSITWNTTSKSSENRPGTNGFGAVVEMTESTSTHYAISFPYSEAEEPVSYWDSKLPKTISVTAEVEPSKAERIKGQLRVLVVCKIAASNPLSRGDDLHSATFESPTESQDTYKYLHVIPTEFWIFNGATGEVFAKTRPLEIVKKLKKPTANEKLVAVETDIDRLAARVAANPALLAQMQTNNRQSYSSASKAATTHWDIANVGHAITDEELPQMVEKGQASRFIIVTTPTGADIDIDGDNAGRSPMAFYLMRHADVPRIIAIKMDGYATIERNFMPDGNDIALDLKMEKK